MCCSKGGNQRKTFLPSPNNFMVPHPGRTIIDKCIGERLSTAYITAARAGNAVKANMTVASKPTDHDIVGDETENNSANPQTLVEEMEHINPPEEPELIANADYHALKKPVLRGFLF
ncbi:hypothetical protein TNCV_220461 [Trichonephila clavipes]|nr:hypothetical protein TNCV_220461 [Trichonephila clavipes]